MPVLSGVPQGSVLGPLLFLILIGDIDSDISTSFLQSFADDTRIGGRIRSCLDSQNLQIDLNIVYQWAEQNNMSFNNSKFELIHYGKMEHHTDYQYLNQFGVPIPSKLHVKDLGVIMSNTCTFSEHILSLTETVRKLIGWILRTFLTREAQPMLTLWKSLVIPRVDYCSQLWSPTKKGEILQLEDLQRNYIKKIQEAYGLSYTNALCHFHLYSLQRRRERYCIIYVWKILENLVPNLSVHIIVKSSNRKWRSCYIESKTSKAPKAIQSLKFTSFRTNGSPLFNQMPEEIRQITQCTTSCFKNQLDNFLSLIPDDPYTTLTSNSIVDMVQYLDPERVLAVPFTFISGWNPGVRRFAKGGNPLSP